VADPFDSAIERISKVEKLLGNIGVGNPSSNQSADIDQHVHLLGKLIEIRSVALIIPGHNAAKKFGSWSRYVTKRGVDRREREGRGSKQAGARPLPVLA
jgi:hypothetical protein